MKIALSILLVISIGMNGVLFYTLRQATEQYGELLVISCPPIQQKNWGI